MIHPGVQIKSVEGYSLFSDANFFKKWPYFSVKAVLVHAQVMRCIPESDDAGNNERWMVVRLAHDISISPLNIGVKSYEGNEAVKTRVNRLKGQVFEGFFSLTTAV